MISGDQVRHHTQPSAVSALPTTQRIRQVPRLPRKVPPDPAQRSKCHAMSTVDVAKSHICQTIGTWMSSNATLATQSAAASPATNGQSTVDVARCYTCHAIGTLMSRAHACHAKCRGFTATRPCQSRLARSTVDVATFHVCHAKSTVESPSVSLPCNWNVDAAKCRAATKRAGRPSPVPYVPRLPSRKYCGCRDQVVCERLCVTTFCVTDVEKGVCV